VCQLCGTTRIIADYAGLPHHEPPIKVDSFALAGFRGTPWDYRKMTLNQRVAGSSPARLTIYLLMMGHPRWVPFLIFYDDVTVEPRAKDETVPRQKRQRA
jgi:hypothetical protein